MKTAAKANMPSSESIAGFDCTWDASRKIPQIIERGYKAVGRYLWEIPSSRPGGKGITKAEAEALSAAGIMIWLAFEANGDDPASFTSDNGKRHAERALNQLAAVGVPQTAAVYFCIDYPATMSQSLAAYFTAVQRALVGSWRVGAYGSGAALRGLSNAGLIEFGWLAGATGWPGYGTFPDWSIRQSAEENDPVLGDIDPDRCILTSFGGFMLDVPSAPVSAVHPLLRRGSVLSVAVSEAQQRLNLHGASLKVDGDFGPLTATATKLFQKERGLDPDGVIGPATWAALYA